MLQIMNIKVMCIRANVEKIDAGPKGAVITFRDNIFANPAGLIAYIRERGRDAKVRPDQKVVFLDDWGSPKVRLKAAADIMRRLVRIAGPAKAA